MKDLLEKEFLNIREKVFHLAGRDRVEIVIRKKKGFLLRVAEGRFHQSCDQEDLNVYIRLVTEGKTGRIDIALTDASDLEKAVFEARAIARSRRKPDHSLPLVTGARYREVGDYDPSFFRVSLRQVHRKLGKVFFRFERERAKASGYYSQYLRTVYVANNAGLHAFHASSAFRFGLTVRRGEGIGYASAFHPVKRYLSYESVAEEALEKVRLSRKTIRVKPGFYPVVLSPRALAEFLSPLLEEMNGRKVLEGDSFFTGKRGRRLFAECVHLEDDVYHEAQTGLPFDAEGIARKRVGLIEKGRVKDFVYDRRTAHELGISPSGHSAGPLQKSAVPSNIVFKPGRVSSEEMIRNIRRGILISHIWYHHVVNPNTLLSTGLAKGRALWIDQGEIVGGIGNPRYLTSIAEALRDTVLVSHDTRTIKDREWGACVLPYLLIENFRVV